MSDVSTNKNKGPSSPYRGEGRATNYVFVGQRGKVKHVCAQRMIVSLWETMHALLTLYPLPVALAPIGKEQWGIEKGVSKHKTKRCKNLAKKKTEVL